MTQDTCVNRSVRKSSQHLWLLLAALLFSSATSTPMQCTCWEKIHTSQCVGCTHLPKTVPLDVSRLNMTGNHVSRIHVAADVSSALSDLKIIYLNNNIISALQNGDLCPFKSLMTLDLSANNLESVEENSIACNGQLKRLVLNDNPHLQLGALRSQSLEHLFLENCGLTNLDHTLLRHLPALRGLYLRGNADLPCAQVVQDLRERHPLIDVYCDIKTAAAKSITTTSAGHPTATDDHHNNPIFSINPGYPQSDLPSQRQDAPPVNIQIVAPIPVVPLVVLLVLALIVILAVVSVAAIFRCRQKPGRDIRPGDESGDRQLLEEPC